ncbi:MAG: ATP-binding cassette domain-containing protein [Bacilli bacterium]|nr:ATP-binding cassette domain-containing protein [Bacilli bacterium]
MLKINGVYKTYHPKKGVPVKALVNVSIDFQEKGLIFILGKSGSGKSTMLNIIGGLDKADQGDIIIKGKSSSQFKSSDFDNYRNTFVGFVFQEYNLLNDFNIGKNIALALELQGKKSDKASVDDILSKVDLLGYENRKVNELSGGQKQRVAIARALIKQPEIILADEPTGALDSVTGRQVFEILKKLGKEKLVIVVSHDRETAEEYADRIVEMKDGMVSSDTSKAIIKSEEIMPGVLVNKNMVHFANDHQFSIKDFDLIKNLQKNNLSVIITNDEKLLSNHVFKQTDQETIDTRKYDGSKLKFISSKLKNTDSLKIGASGLKYKKVRLFFTILLSFIAVSFFALTDTLSAFNGEESHARTLQSNNINSVTLSQYYRIQDSGYYYDQTMSFSKEQINNMVDDFPNASIMPTIEENLELLFDYETISSLSANDLILYNFLLSYQGVKLFISDDYLENQEIDLLAGNFPTNDEEFMITSFEMQLYKRFSFPYFDFNELNVATAKYILPNQFTTNEEDNANLIIGKSVDANAKNRKISGVIDISYDSNYLSETFLEEANDDYVLRQEFNQYIEEHNLGAHFLREEAFDAIKNPIEGLSNHAYDSGASFIASYGVGQNYTNYIDFFVKEDDLNSEQLIKFTNEPLKNDEIIVSVNILTQLFSYEDVIRFTYDMDTYEQLLVIDFGGTDQISFNTINGIMDWDQADPLNHQRLVNLFSSEDDIEITNYNLKEEVSSYKLAGLYFPRSHTYWVDEFDETFYPFNMNVLSMTLNDFNGEKYNLAFIDNLVFIVNDGTNLYDQYMKIYHYDSPFSIEIHSEFSSIFSVFDSLVVGLRVIFLILGSILAVFSALLMMNFIATSISYKKHDIGILRGLGARRIDVVKIFTFESLIIATINILLAIATTIPAIYLINQQIASALEMNILFLGFTFRQFALIVLIAVGSALIASILPVLNIARKKPIDAINNR